MTKRMVRDRPFSLIKWLTTVRRARLFLNVHRSKERCILLLPLWSISFTMILYSWNASKIHLRIVLLDVDRCSIRVFENKPSRSLKNSLLHIENAICIVTTQRIKKYFIFFTSSRPMRLLYRGALCNCSVIERLFVRGVFLPLSDISIRWHSHTCWVILSEDVEIENRWLAFLWCSWPTHIDVIMIQDM